MEVHGVYQQEKIKHKFICACAVSRYVAEIHLKPQSRTMKPIKQNTFRHCRVRFSWTTFLETAVYVICFAVIQNSKLSRVSSNKEFSRTQFLEYCVLKHVLYFTIVLKCSFESKNYSRQKERKKLWQLKDSNTGNMWKRLTNNRKIDLKTQK